MLSAVVALLALATVAPAQPPAVWFWGSASEESVSPWESTASFLSQFNDSDAVAGCSALVGGMRASGRVLVSVQ